MTRDEMISDLRELADFLETHPQVATPTYVQLDAFPDLAEYQATARAATWAKQPFDTWQALVRTGPHGTEYHVNIPREQVCRRVVTGTRIVAASPEHEVEDYTWDCEPILGAR